MNKQDLIGSVADRVGLPRNEAAAVVDSMLDVITETLRSGADVRLVGFGTFSVTHRKPSVGRNPRTGAPMSIAATSQAKFRAGKVLRAALG